MSSDLPTEIKKTDLMIQMFGPDISIPELGRNVTNHSTVVLREREVDEAPMLIFDRNGDAENISEIATPPGLKQANVSFRLNFSRKAGLFDIRTKRVTEGAEPEDSDVQTNIASRRDVQGVLKVARQLQVFQVRKMQGFKGRVHGAGGKC